MKKYLVWGLIVILALSLALTGCGKKEEPTPAPEPAEGEEATDATWERIVAEGKLVAGLDDNYPPMGFRDEKGELVGFDIEMGAEIGRRLGIEIVWQPTAWDGVVASLKAQKFDVIISGMTITEERAKEVNFAGPYIHAAQAIVVQEANTEILAAADLKEKIVGTQNGSAGYKVCEELQAEGLIKEIKGYSDYALAFQDLKIGRLDAIVADDYVAAAYMQNMPGEFKFTGELFAEETQGIAVRKEDTVLFEKLNTTINEMLLDGTLAALSEKWLGGDVTQKLVEDLQK